MKTVQTKFVKKGQNQETNLKSIKNYSYSMMCMCW